MLHRKAELGGSQSCQTADSLPFYPSVLLGLPWDLGSQPSWYPFQWMRPKHTPSITHSPFSWEILLVLCLCVLPLGTIKMLFKKKKKSFCEPENVSYLSVVSWSQGFIYLSNRWAGNGVWTLSGAISSLQFSRSLVCSDSSELLLCPAVLLTQAGTCWDWTLGDFFFSCKTFLHGDSIFSWNGLLCLGMETWKKLDMMSCQNRDLASTLAWLWCNLRSQWWQKAKAIAKTEM